MSSSSARPSAYSYVRFSTAQQTHGDSYRRQSDAAKEYADRQGLELNTTLIFHDLGVSAWSGKNVATGALGPFLEAVHRGLIERGSYLLVENLDRLSRQAPWDAIALFQKIINAGITVVTLQDGKVWSEEEIRANPFKIMESIMYMVRANEESEVKSWRARNAWEAKRKAAPNKIVTSRVPSWLKIVGTDSERRFEVVEDRAAVVRRIYAMTLQGIGQHKIAETLNNERVPTFRTAKCWHRTFVRDLLSYEGVIGTYEPKTVTVVNGVRKYHYVEKVPDYYPRIIDQEVFLNVRAMLSSKAPRGRHAGGSNGSVSNVLVGLARCPLCGCTVTLLTHRKDLRYLACVIAKAKGGCSFKPVNYELIDYALATSGWIVDHLEPETDPFDAAIAREQAALGDLRKTLDGLLSAFTVNTPHLVAAKVRQLQADHDAIQARIDDLERQREEVSSRFVEARIGDLIRAFNDGDTSARNRALRVAVSQVVVDNRTNELVFHWRHGPVTYLNYAPFAPTEAVH